MKWFQIEFPRQAEARRLIAKILAVYPYGRVEKLWALTDPILRRPWSVYVNEPVLRILAELGIYPIAAELPNGPPPQAAITLLGY
ncbi:MAG TPA: hypothetical protein VFU23_07200 [Gemmatimonadales bacterium]|nr:hypothetical protein [Gemmatimonadales bacterium]